MAREREREKNENNKNPKPTRLILQTSEDLNKFQYKCKGT